MSCKRMRQTQYPWQNPKGGGQLVVEVAKRLRWRYIIHASASVFFGPMRENRHMNHFLISSARNAGMPACEKRRGNACMTLYSPLSIQSRGILFAAVIFMQRAVGGRGWAVRRRSGRVARRTRALRNGRCRRACGRVARIAASGGRTVARRCRTIVWRCR